MKKKVVTMIAAFAVGGIMLAGGTFAAMAQTAANSGNKAVIVKAPELSDATAKVDVIISDNGNGVATVKSLIKFDQIKHTSSQVSDINYGEKASKEESYIQDGKAIFKTGDSDIFSIVESNTVSGKPETGNDQLKQGFEGIIDDYISTRFQSYEAVVGEDGSKRLDIRLEDSQITPADNAMICFALRLANGNGYQFKSFTVQDDSVAQELKGVIPELSSDVKVKAVNISAEIKNDNVLDYQIENITITGTDEQGKNHDVNITLAVFLKDIGQTTPDQIDLKGKQVKTVIYEVHKRRRE